MKLEVCIPLFPALSRSGLQPPFNAYHIARTQRCLVSHVDSKGTALCHTLESATPEHWHISYLQPYDPDGLWKESQGARVGTVSWIVDTEEIHESVLPPALKGVLDAMRKTYHIDDKTLRLLK